MIFANYKEDTVWIARNSLSRVVSTTRERLDIPMKENFKFAKIKKLHCLSETSYAVLEATKSDGKTVAYVLRLRGASLSVKNLDLASLVIASIELPFDNLEYSISGENGEFLMMRNKDEKVGDKLKYY